MSMLASTIKGTENAIVQYFKLVANYTIVYSYTILLCIHGVS